MWTKPDFKLDGRAKLNHLKIRLPRLRQRIYCYIADIQTKISQLYLNSSQQAVPSSDGFSHHTLKFELLTVDVTVNSVPSPFKEYKKFVRF